MTMFMVPNGVSLAFSSSLPMVRLVAGLRRAFGAAAVATGGERQSQRREEGGQAAETKGLFTHHGRFP